MTDLRSSVDLRDYLAAVDLCYFDGQLDDLGVSIHWMRPARGKVLITNVLGFFRPESLRIEIARVLAYPWVSRQFLLQTIYHEGLHAVVGLDHDRTFHLAEKQFVHTFDVWQWERENRSRITDTPEPKGLR